MANSTKKILKQEYDRLKKVFQKLAKPQQQQSQPQLVLQPIRNNRSRF